jgi:hypothetical protein
MEFDPVFIARLQFAFTVIFHIIFPTFTIGLSAYIATLLVMWRTSGLDRYQRLARFWTRIFAVSFAMGVVSGIVLSYEFGTNWSKFSVFAGNVIGPLTGYEVLSESFLQSRLRSAPRSRRSGSSRPIHGCRRRPAMKSMTALSIHSTGGRSSSIRASPIVSPTCSTPPI